MAKANLLLPTTKFCKDCLTFTIQKNRHLEIITIRIGKKDHKNG